MHVEPDAKADTGSSALIAPGVRRIVAPNPGPLTGSGTNTYVIGEERPVIVDPGPADPAHIERVLDACMVTPALVVCTHSHPDHSPGAALLTARIPGLSVAGRSAPDDGHQDPDYAPDRTLEDGDVVETDAGTLRVLHTPGHASNHVCLLLEQGGLLFTGDHLMQGSTVVILPPDGSMADYLESLGRLAELAGLHALAPGHGQRIPDARGEIARVITHRLARERKVLDALAGHANSTVEELLPVVYADVPRGLHLLARHSLLAHLLKLHQEGRVQCDGERFRICA